MVHTPIEPAAIKALREKCLSREGKNGIRALAKFFGVDRVRGGDDSHVLQAKDFRKGLRDFGLIVSDEDFESPVGYLDPQGEGFISLPEFIVAIRGAISPRRVTVVQAAFRRLDVEGTGELKLENVRDFYQTVRHPAVQNRKASVEEIASKFLSLFTGETNLDGIVTFEEFLNYYAGVSYSVATDMDFELLLSRSWNLDRPAKLSRDQEIDRCNQTAVSKHGGTHPLYQTNSKCYGTDLEQAFVPETRYNKAGRFTKHEPPPSPSCGLNTSMTRTRFY